ncbi:hypothetical protein ACFU5O_08750 [Streptomyces sp. NPDC057445]|uniref:hypothetical protein n=1 Tax=Streptomyces sp. NPDC057445 TaxID=3346136 RepID=UPI0036875F49
MPQQLFWVQGLQWLQVALTALYVLTVLSMVTYYNGELFGILLYDSLPSVIGAYLAHRAWRGGLWVSRGLIVVQGWLLWLAFVTLLHLDYRGLSQSVIPIAVIVLLRMPEVRAWFDLAPDERKRPRPFRIERMIRWRRDQGQTAMEYLGLVLVVAAIIGGLVATGIGSELTNKIAAQVSCIGGGDCGGGGDTGGTNGGGDTEAGPAEGDGTGGSSGGTGGSGGATGGSSGGDLVEENDFGTMSGDDRIPVAPGPLEREVDPEDFKDDGTEPIIPEERHDRTFWDHARGFVMAPTVGFINDTVAFAANPKKTIEDTWEGLENYSQDWWKKNRPSVGQKWKNGDKLGASWDAFTGGLSFTKDFTVDMFVDKENWKKGNYGASTGNTILGVIGIFSPKSLKKFKKLGDLGGKRDFPDTPNGRAAESAQKAKEEAKRGDLDQALKHADEAQKHADHARRIADRDQKKQCKGLALASVQPAAANTGGPRGATRAMLAVYQGGAAGGIVRTGTNTCGDDDDDVVEANKAEREALNARADVLREVLKQAKKDDVHVQSNALDDFLARAKDDSMWDQKEYTSKEAADALDDVTKLVQRKNIDGLSREKLAYKVLNSPNKDKLAENLAEANATRRIAENEAADGTTVYSGPGDTAKNPKHRGELSDGKGGTIDVSGIPDADVAYRGKDGKVHVVEVKNRANATTQPSLPEQVKRLGEWQKKEPGRQARYEIESTDKWTQIFEQFNYKKQSKTEKREGKPKVRPPGNPAQEMAKNNVGARIAGQDVSPSQLNRMEAAWNGKSDAEKAEAIRSGKMKDPKTAMEYLGVS